MSCLGLKNDTTDQLKAERLQFGLATGVASVEVGDSASTLGQNSHAVAFLKDVDYYNDVRWKPVGSFKNTGQKYDFVLLEDKQKLFALYRSDNQSKISLHFQCAFLKVTLVSGFTMHHAEMEKLMLNMPLRLKIAVRLFYTAYARFSIQRVNQLSMVRDRFQNCLSKWTFPGQRNMKECGKRFNRS
ncbi:hypothetical protein T02_13032 [Trichinella nativa]|uniref:Uncharacterized protein n=1 Tax=Trichinella nativa TaxID=6335 RepID=A0A0V1KN00_9BILA|nr:hypothetical protein T02_8470 [Trichinella nativa]KRZ48735.1 hypothetical protein T02_13886 [Trichinella nativa]KRZ51415.1 hypothetical protein T02_16251 [Trichinella nativa]KRZ54983.1 hypothetical protein T02_8210 [Trichinella nativa]KRZ59815.1 hypothetical protein T02_13032 [Trichinella nativa]